MIIELEGQTFEIKFTQKALRRFEEKHKVGILKYFGINPLAPMQELDVRRTFIDELFQWGVYHEHPNMKKEEIERLTDIWIERDGMLNVYTALLEELAISIIGEKKIQEKVKELNISGQDS